MNDANTVAGNYTIKLEADSGYEAEQTGRCSPNQWGAILRVLNDPKLAEEICSRVPMLERRLKD